LVGFLKQPAQGDGDFLSALSGDQFDQGGHLGGDTPSRRTKLHQLSAHGEEIPFAGAVEIAEVGNDPLNGLGPIGFWRTVKPAGQGDEALLEVRREGSEGDGHYLRVAEFLIGR
jgi:hypothetical protein